MAAWTPVIAYKKWWALETVKDWLSWIFFEEQTVESLEKAINDFENMTFDHQKIRQYAISFDKEKFKENIRMIQQIPL